MGSCVNSNRDVAAGNNVKVSSTYSCIRNINLSTGEYKTPLLVTVKDEDNVVWVKEYDIHNKL